MAREIIFRHLHELDHSFVRFARRAAEGKNAVVHEHHANRADSRFLAELDRTQACEVEAWHDVGNDHGLAPVNLAYARFSVCCIGHRANGVGVSMVNELVRQDRVQYGLH